LCWADRNYINLENRSRSGKGPNWQGVLSLLVLITLCAQASSKSNDTAGLLYGIIDPNAITPSSDPNDEFFSKQWHLSNTGQSGGTAGADINALAAWEITTGDPNVVIAVIDSGVDPSHPDLINNLVPGYDFVEDDDRPDPSLYHPLDAHGTLIAGIAAAQGNNGMGVVGVAPKCKIMPIRIHSARRGLLWEDDLAEALRWAALQGADIISNSWGFPWESDVIHSAVKDVTSPGGIGRAGKGCVVVWAVDFGGRPIRSGAQEAYKEVIAVGAVDHNDVRWNFSDYGPELDLMAPSSESDGEGSVWTTDVLGMPGVSLFNEDPNLLDYTGEAGGTSMCAPMVAGVAALILSIDPNLSNEEVRRYLLSSARDLGDPGRDDYYGWGCVDAGAALDMLQTERADVNLDQRVNLQDFALVAQSWPQRGSLKDLALVTDYWLAEFGLISHWPLDDAEGMTVSDEVTHRQGTLHGYSHWQPEPGRIVGALLFDGVDDYVRARVPLNPEDGPFSVFAWIKGCVTGQTILAQDGGADWLVADLQFGHLKTDLKGIDAAAETLLADTSVVTDDNWHHVGFTWDGSTRALYVDGAKVASDTQSQLLGSDGDLLIGTDKKRGGNSFWYGFIDDVRIYRRALGEQEVEILAN
jgi:subtilisin family serine protease